MCGREYIKSLWVQTVTDSLETESFSGHVVRLQCSWELEFVAELAAADMILIQLGF